MDDLLQEFIAETRETLEALSGEIVGWEADPTDRARLDAIFRFVHTIKGSCGFLDLPRLARLSHSAEDALAQVRSGERAPDTALVNAILAIIDRIAELVEAIDAGESLDDDGEDMLIAALDVAPSAGASAELAMLEEAVAPVHAATPAARGAKRSVRLSVDLLDRMMSGVSDMVLARNQLSRHVRDADDPRLAALLERLSMTVDGLRDTVTRTRMQRVEALFSALPRMVRDTAATLGKSVNLIVEGGDVELDREMIELLRDPLVHLVRNAIDHGLEERTDRILSGKPATGELRIVARQAGNLIIIDIADDGRGIDTDRLVSKVRLADPARAGALAAMDEAARLSLIFEPGLSSRDEVTSVSGRGVGMDVVKANIEQIGGRITLSNRPGQGLSVSLEVPLTLAILNAVIVETADTRFAISRQSIEEIVSVDGHTVRVDRVGHASIAVVRGRRLPLVELPTVLGSASATEIGMLAVLTTRGTRFAMALDGVVDTQELVVKPAAPAVMRAGIYAGQMLPDDGAPILLLDCAGVAARAGLDLELRREETVVAEEAPVEAVRALLFRDVDGVRRLIASDAVDRIESVPRDAVRTLAGGLWLTVDGRSVPLWSGYGATAGQVGAVLRINLDDQSIAYPVAEAIEIISLPEDVTAVDAGVISGIAVIEGEPVELIDPLRLFDPAPLTSERPVCLLHGSESGWMEAFLKPTIEQAGYRVVRNVGGGERPTVALAMEEEADSAPVPAIRLSRTRGQPLYRYDRAALIAALQERRA